MEDLSVKEFDSRAHTRSLVRLCTLFLAALACGCSSHQGDLRLVSEDNKRQFDQSFAQAYYVRADTGDADIVLVQDSMLPRRDDADKPLAPDHCLMPRQLVHIHVLWTPMSSVKPDHPANTNSSIHWCLLCDSPDQPGVIDYTGSGLVVLDDSRDGATVTIRKAWMKAGCQRGQVVDPLGPCILAGVFHAVRDETQVNSIIAEMKTRTGPTQEAQAMYDPTQARNVAVGPGN
jgi:hypothetical protein